MSLPSDRITGDLGRITENELWVMSFYRTSEVNGALFFGSVAKSIKGPLVVDVTHHFSDEANHARWWTECIADLDHLPIRPPRAYQDRYLDAVGVPANLMEVMAITLVFEKRVISQYRNHLRNTGIHPAIAATINKIMVDERWHVAYVRAALDDMKERYGADEIDNTLALFTAADQEVYADTLAEFGDRSEFLREQQLKRSEHLPPS